MNLTDIILAAPGDGCVGDCKKGIDAFWASDVGHILGAFMAIAGVVVVIIAVMKCFSKVTSGKIGDAVKVALGAAVFAAFLFNPALLTDLIGMFSTLVEKVIGSFGDVVDKTGTGPSSQ